MKKVLRIEFFKTSQNIQPRAQPSHDNLLTIGCIVTWVLVWVIVKAASEQNLSHSMNAVLEWPNQLPGLLVLGTNTTLASKDATNGTLARDDALALCTLACWNVLASLSGPTWDVSSTNSSAISNIACRFWKRRYSRYLSYSFKYPQR